MANLTDKEAIKALEKTNILELIEMVYDYPEDERLDNNWNDWDVIANETGWLLDSFNSYGCVRHDDLMECKTILHETRYGKVFPVWEGSKRPIWTKTDVENAKRCVNEYNRLKRFARKLYDRGLTLPYYNPYC